MRIYHINVISNIDFVLDGDSRIDLYYDARENYLLRAYYYSKEIGSGRYILEEYKTYKEFSDSKMLATFNLSEDDLSTIHSTLISIFIWGKCPHLVL